MTERCATERLPDERSVLMIKLISGVDHPLRSSVHRVSALHPSWHPFISFGKAFRNEHMDAKGRMKVEPSHSRAMVMNESPSSAAHDQSVRKSIQIGLPPRLGFILIFSLSTRSPGCVGDQTSRRRNLRETLKS
jgi:hypothetical protein